ncbi:MAG: DUF4825 domain-containing protein [Lachnospiraceae bacterium]|nr:DUF4825 domain-containing protein [Lachnospiraceae bacterium]
MTKIPCDVVKDLLPSYVDGLTSDATNRIIEEHIGGCAGCAKTLQDMKVDAGIPQVPEDAEKKELDFLKKNRKRNRMVLLSSIAGALVLILAVLFIRFFVVGEVITGQMDIYDIRVDGNALSIKGSARSNAYYVIKGFSVDEQDGVVTITVRGRRKTLLFRDDETLTFNRTDYCDNEIHTVMLDGRMIWHDGARISALAADIYETRHDYMGDMPANQKTANALCLQAYIGGWSNELLSGGTPLTWILHLEEEISSGRRVEKEKLMEEAAYILLAMAGNLDEVRFTYRCDGEEVSKTVAAKDASAFFGQDIKGCMESARLLDELLHKTSFITYALFDSYGANVKSGIQFNLQNDTNTEIAYISYAVYHEDALMHSGGAMNADESPIGSGEILWFDLEASEVGFSGDTSLEFIIHTTDGKKHRVEERIKFPGASGTLHPLILSGSAEDGFHITQE